MAPAKKRATIRDVAAHAEVSHQTVSRVINHKSNVAPDTRAKVEAAIEALGYRPSQAARSLPRRHSNIIGLIIPYHADYLFRDPHLLAQISGIDAVANAHGYSLLLSTAGETDSSLEAYERFVRHQIADGALVIETAHDQAGANLLTKHHYPHVTLGYGVNKTAPAVHVNDRAGAADLTRHLLTLGHRCIGVINGPVSGAVRAMAERLSGHTNALMAYGLRFDPSLMVYGDYTRPSGQAAAEKLLALPSPPTAIFAFNDRMAIGAMWAITQAGLRIPEDVAVVGFDDIPSAADMTPPLTTVRQPSKEIGQVAARTLIALIKGETITEKTVLLPAEVITRQSA